MKSKLSKVFNKKFIGFLIIGGINTLFTYLVYLFFLLFFSYTISFVISYIMGIIVSYLLNSIIVFKSNLSISKFLKFPVVYVVQFAVNISLLFLFVDLMSINEKIAPLIATIITVPFTYILSKYILSNNK